jgi:hypothetical protein
VYALRSSFVALSVVGGLACAGIGPAPEQGGRKDGGGILLDVKNAADQQPCVVVGAMPIAPRPADVLILFDRSGSMDAAFGAGSRYQALAALVSDLVTSYQGHVRFGYMEMPGRTGCVNQSLGCCASPPSVELALGNALAMTTAIRQAVPLGGNTPTASALLAARVYFDQLDDGIDNRYVLLTTDGPPSCTLSGTLSEGNGRTAPACLDALVEVQGLVASGVKVLVLAVGAEVGGGGGAGAGAGAGAGGEGCLDALAHAGGAALSPGAPGYYSAANPDQIEAAIEQIFGAVGQPSCVVPLPPDAKQGTIAVYLDGYEIPEVPNDLADGWCRNCSPNPADIRITGAYCEQIQRFQVDGFEVHYEVGCAPPLPP